ncbi:MAG TPA: XdhC/CoxI family protein [Thermoanaerobaculia bacterium]|jgi:xanthine dehydrogenase accessory factor|nr:XdhC/CoxI family protein [Thermoanaerobaculia bacterium]
MSEIPGPAEVLAEAECSLHSHGRVALCQIVRTEGSTPGKPGWKLLARPDGTTYGNLGGGAFEAMVCADARARLANGAGKASEIKRYYFTEDAVKGEPTGMVCGGMAEVFLEILEAPPVLVVCGGGPVGQALARAGSLAGFECLVTDDRPEFRQPGLFPEGALVAEVGRDYNEPFLEPVQRRDLYVAVVTRCWETDTAALAGILRQDPPSLRYLGLMGSRRKVARVREEVEALGFDLSARDLKAPIGLPIGGDTPGEIAISILAEAIRTRYGRPVQKDGDD